MTAPDSLDECEPVELVAALVLEERASPALDRVRVAARNLARVHERVADDRDDDAERQVVVGDGCARVFRERVSGRQGASKGQEQEPEEDGPNQLMIKLIVL